MTDITPEETKYSQVCVWGSTIVGAENAKAFVDFMKSEYKIRVKYLEEIKTNPDMKNGKAVKGTGGRNDVFFAIHSDDIVKFAITRLSMDPPVRWIEDVLGNEKRKEKSSLYPESVRKYLTWEYSGDETKQIETLRGLNQSLIFDYVWDTYEDDCLERASEYNDSYNDDEDYSGDRD